MPPLFINSQDVSSDMVTQYLYFLNRHATTPSAITLPAELKAIKARPFFATYDKKMYVAGMLSRVFVMDGRMVPWASGIHAPAEAPTLATTSTSTLTGDCIGYTTYRHKYKDILIQESALSPASASVTVDGKCRLWTVEPHPTDAAVTHVAGWCSVDGGIPHMAWERPYVEEGSISVTESVTSDELAEAPSAPVATDESTGESLLDPDARGVLPYASVICVWHERLWAICPGRRGVYFSMLREPESFNMVDTEEGVPPSFIGTGGGEMPISLCALGDELGVFCRTCVYSIQGWGTSDFRMEKVSNVYGSISSHGPKTIQGVVIFPAIQGIIGWFGGRNFRNLMAHSYRDAWATAYEAAPAVYQAGESSDDRRGANYLYIVTQATDPQGLAWVGHYRPLIESGAPELLWSWDIETRANRAIANIWTEDELGDVARGGDDDGYVRVELSTDDDDDGDTTYKKHMVIRHKHFYFGDQSGNDQHGRSFHSFCWFGKNVNTAITVNLYGGDEEAASTTDIMESVSLAAVSNSVYPAKTTHEEPLAKAGGKGVTVEITADNPVDVQHKGFAIRFNEGAQVRK